MFSHSPSSYRFALYVRKSSESEDRQVLSLESQIQHLKEYAQKQGFIIHHIYEDAASAHKINNRPQFTQMCLDIHAKKFDGILCWKADRLARNPIEGGQILYALQTQALKIIATPYQIYFPENNTLPLTIEFGMANQYSLDLSKNIKRGNRTKVEGGGWCSRAPVGYLNDRINKTIVKDPERFQYVRKMFQYYLTGNYALNDICTIAHHQWGFKTLKRAKIGGTPLSLSTLSKVLHNPFYAGWVCTSGTVARGNHTPMISQKEFDTVQSLLARKTGKKYRKFHADELPYKNLMTCGECAGSITAQKKTKYSCPKCKKKHCSRKPKKCSCGHLVQQKTIENGTHYYYYHCTKQKGKSQPEWTKCTQPYVSHKAIEKQIQTSIELLTPFHEPFVAWLAQNIAQQQEHWQGEHTKEKEVLVQQKKKLTKKIEQLLELTLDGILSSDEFKTQKFALEQKKQRLSQDIKRLKSRKIYPNVENVCKRLKSIGGEFKNLPGTKKKQLLKIIASNRVLQDKKLVIEWNPMIKTLLELHKVYKGTFEPLVSQSGSGIKGDKNTKCFTWSSQLEQLRTHLKNFELPPI